MKLPAWLSSTTSKLVLLIALVLLAGSLGFTYFEREGRGEDVFTALWWTVVTLTTVGYGDVVPLTTGGRVTGFLVMVCGIGLVSTLTGNLASLLVDRKVRKRKGLLAVKKVGHIVVMGWNGFALNLVKNLGEAGLLKERGLVLVNALPQDARDQIAYQLDLGDNLEFVFGNIIQESVVHRARPEAAKVIYLLSQENMEAKDADQQTLYAALAVREQTKDVPLYCEVVLPENRKHLLRAGATETLIRGEIASRVLGLMGSNQSVWAFLQTLLGMRGDNVLDFRPLNAEEKAGSWRGLADSMRRADGCLPLALCQFSRALSLGDILDEGQALDKFILELFQNSGRDTRLGSQGPGVRVNPPDDEPLAAYDAVLFLKPGAAQ
ncbi:potassium channel family protein [Desulfovibrio aminophilus]|uniref:potassium channel family protein n=1 Tax=Desulfovibrio aminophilus TaxID=81425 RepID=UPI00041116BC|nr:potassium channel family protein [Desulfovibrio aminophilus]